MRPPKIPAAVDYLVIESTYGNRLHQPTGKIEDDLAALITKAEQEDGVILIPSFALERTQEIVYVIQKLLREKRIRPIHFYVDSPMAVDITQVFAKHLSDGYFTLSFEEYARKVGDPFGLETVRYIKTVEESKSLNNLKGRKIILSASGMCEGGRILHHLRNNIDKDSTTILLVGYQAQGTLGRRLQEKAPKVKIFGLLHEVRARVETMHHFSSHADQSDLNWFIRGFSPRPRGIFLVHGDPQCRDGLAAELASSGFDRVFSPALGQNFPLN